MRMVVFFAASVIYLLIVLQALTQPQQVMRDLGAKFEGANGLSEFHAIYVGIWLITAAMLIYAGLHPEQQVLAQFAALMVLAQPLGRLVALIRAGLPEGKLRVMFALEAVGGVLLFWMA